MPDTDEAVQTETGSEDSPPESPVTAPPEETGQEETTPDETVGAETAEEDKLTPFHEHPDWKAREEKLREAEIDRVRAEARAEALAQQLQTAQTAPKEEPRRHTLEDVRRMRDEGEISDDQYLEFLATQKAQEMAEQMESNRRRTDSEQRALQLVPDIGQVGSPGNQLFNQLAAQDVYSSLFKADGTPAVYNAYEIVAREVKAQMATKSASDAARTSEEARRQSIASQAATNDAPHGRGGEEEMTDSVKKLTDVQRQYLTDRNSGRPPTDKEAREYLENKPESTRETYWPERAVR